MTDEPVSADEGVCQKTSRASAQTERRQAALGRLLSWPETETTVPNGSPGRFPVVMGKRLPRQMAPGTDDGTLKSEHVGKTSNARVWLHDYVTSVEVAPVPGVCEGFRAGVNPVAEP